MWCKILQVLRFRSLLRQPIEKPDDEQSYDSELPDEKYHISVLDDQSPPPTEFALYNEGCALQQSGNIKEAINCYRATITLNPQHFRAHYNLANALLELEEKSYKEAEKCYKRALQIQPHNLEAFYNLGHMYQDQGLTKQSIACFRRAAAIDVEDTDTQVALGLALKLANQFQAAEDCFLQALRFNPHSTMALFNLGNMYQDREMLKEAIACFNKVLQLEPEHHDAAFNTAVAFHHLAQKSTSKSVQIEAVHQALIYYRESMMINPHDEVALAAIAELNFLLT